MGGPTELYDALIRFDDLADASPDGRIKLDDVRPILDAVELRVKSNSNSFGGEYILSGTNTGADALLLTGMIQEEERVSPPVRPGRSELVYFSDKLDESGCTAVLGISGNSLGFVSDNARILIYVGEREGDWSRAPDQFPLTLEACETFHDSVSTVLN
ncbi:hypothetical protein [Haloarcula sp. 1CSR25-25]|uniref:hypothetical protein n=1 Tax=Haloarcula sp. 1CSR25-25 TaxID=2862545 RepID=UPI002894DB89|nr:hypothetical protein [Haloarcula sp. 1CSR25-25]MDT3434666.1 hypothetical protein [Haloarcula sp. 1CSR25-25]